MGFPILSVGGGVGKGLTISSGTTHFKLHVFQKPKLSRPSLSALARRKFEETSHFLGRLGGMSPILFALTNLMESTKSPV